MAFNDCGLAFDLADTVAQVRTEFVECFELGFGRKVSVQVADQADAD